MGGKIINTITEIIPIHVDRYPFWCPCFFVLIFPFDVFSQY